MDGLYSHANSGRRSSTETPSSGAMNTPITAGCRNRNFERTGPLLHTKATVATTAQMREAQGTTPLSNKSIVPIVMAGSRLWLVYALSACTGIRYTRTKFQNAMASKSDAQIATRLRMVDLPSLPTFELSREARQRLVGCGGWFGFPWFWTRCGNPSATKTNRSRETERRPHTLQVHQSGSPDTSDQNFRRSEKESLQG